MIIGKKITDENEPIATYSTPFDTIVNIVDINDEVDGSSWQLLANEPGPDAERPFTSVKILEHERYDQPYYGFSKMAIKADFRSWLREFGCISGEYGLKITVDFAAEQTLITEEVDEFGNKQTYKTYPVERKILYLKDTDMIGNPYAFDTYYTQQKAFDISEYSGISYIKVEFFQMTGTFKSSNKDANGQNILVPHTDDFGGTLLPPNLFLSDFYISIGYDLDAYDTDFVQLYSFDQPIYNTEDDVKNIVLRWIHLHGEEQIVMSPEIDDDKYEIRWYRYVMGEPAADDYVTGGWTSIDNEINKEFLMRKDENPLQCFEVTLKPEADKRESEQIKAIILYGDKPEDYEKYTFADNALEALQEYSKNPRRFYIKDGDEYKNCADLPYPRGSYYENQKGKEFDPNSASKYYRLLFRRADATKIEKFEERYDDYYFIQEETGNFIQCDKFFTFDEKETYYVVNDQETQVIPEKKPTATEFYDNPGNYWVKERIFKTIVELENGKPKDLTLDTSKDYWTVSRVEMDSISAEVFRGKEKDYYLKREFSKMKGDYYIRPADPRTLYRTKPITFTNGKELDNSNTIIDKLQALSLRCFDIKDNTYSYTYGNYFLYNELKELIDYEDSKILRGVHCVLDLIETNDIDTNLLRQAESISWIIPSKNTMIVEALHEGGNGYASPTIKKLNINLEEIDDTADNIADIYYTKYIYETAKIEEQFKKELIGAPCFFYKIPSRLMAQRGTNLIRCEVKLNDIVYAADYDLTFGEYGSSGTNYTFQIEVISDEKILTANESNNLTIRAMLYDKKGEEIDITNNVFTCQFVNPADSSGTLTELNGLTIEPITTDDKGQSINNQWKLSNTGSLDINTICILKITLNNWEEFKLIDYLNIPIRADKKYTNFTGPTEIIYLTDGTPYYSSLYTYLGLGYLNENGEYREDRYYNWESYVGGENEESLDAYFPELKPVALNNENSSVLLQPLSMYVSGLPLYSVQAKDKDTNSVVWTQPILIIQNAYPSSLVNEWNGKELVIDTNNQLIFTKMLGAGHKDEENKFTGVLLGDWVNKANSDTGLGSGTGIFGMNKGVQCFSFTEDGKATIGKASGAQLVFDGEQSTIQSKSYGESGQGLLLDFDAGTINSKRNIEGKTSFAFSLQQTSPYFTLNSSIFNDSGDNIPLMEVGDDSYYLQSANYSEGTASSISYTYSYLGRTNNTNTVKGWINKYGNICYSNSSGGYTDIFTTNIPSSRQYYYTKNTYIKDAGVPAVGSKFDLVNGAIEFNRGKVNGDIILAPSEGLVYDEYYYNSSTGAITTRDNPVNLTSASLGSILTDLKEAVSRAQASADWAAAAARAANSALGSATTALNTATSAMLKLAQYFQIQETASESLDANIRMQCYRGAAGYGNGAVQVGDAVYISGNEGTSSSPSTPAISLSGPHITLSPSDGTSINLHGLVRVSGLSYGTGGPSGTPENGTLYFKYKA